LCNWDIIIIIVVIVIVIITIVSNSQHHLDSPRRVQFVDLIVLHRVIF
jgi:hypothetical protein